MAVQLDSLSIRKTFDEFQCFVTPCGQPFEVIWFAETWLGKDDENLYYFPSGLSQCCNKDTSIYGGAFIFIYSELNFKSRLHLSLNVRDCETVLGEIDK